MQTAYLFFGAIFTIAVAYSAGAVLLRKLRLALFREETHLFRFFSGSALLSLFVFLLCTVGQARKGIFLACGCTLIAVCLWRRVYRVEGPSLAPLPQAWRAAFLGLFMLFGTVYAVNAMAPEHSPDGQTYHLGLVARYARAYGFERVGTNMYAHLSQGMEMLFLHAFVFGKHSSAAMVHLAFLLALPWAVLSFGRRHGRPVAAVVGACLALLSPVMGIDGSSAYNDVAAACLLFAVFWALEIEAPGRETALLALIGLLAGFCFAVKYTAGLALPYAFGVVLWRSWRRPPAAARAVLIVGACAAISAVPWMLKNTIYVGNPLAPFFNSFFPNPYVHIDFEESYRADMRHFNQINDADILLAVTMRGGVLGGLVGPVFLLTPLALLALRHKLGRRVLLAGVIFTLPYSANVGTRFLIPGLPFWSLGIGLALDALPVAAALLLAAHAVLCWPWVVLRYCDLGAWTVDEFPWRAALRLTPEDTFLRERSPGYSIARLLEERTEPGERVFAFGSHAADAYTAREILVSFQGGLNRSLTDILYTPTYVDWQPTRGLEFRLSGPAIRELRVIQTTRHPINNWSISELRLFRSGAELPREAGWRIRASANPWDVQWAFDNSPLTRWSSRQSLRPGMFLQVDFGKAVEIDSVLLECTRDQQPVQVRLEVAGEEGIWREAQASFREYALPVPPSIFRSATRELRTAGVRYVLIDKDDHGAEGFLSRPERWGLRLLEQAGQTYLFEVE